jgi:phosphoribosylformylglycinamidine (FGAM) synthase-like enzyme
MKTETKHSPLPWGYDLGHTIAEVDGDEWGESIVQLPAGTHDRRPTAREKANAALIVRAVNHHESLVSALADLRNAGRAAGFSGLSPDSWLRIALEKAERALANMETP